MNLLAVLRFVLAATKAPPRWIDALDVLAEEIGREVARSRRARRRKRSRFGFIRTGR